MYMIYIYIYMYVYMYMIICIYIYICIYIHISPANARIEDMRVLICFGDQLSLVSGSQTASVS